MQQSPNAGRKKQSFLPVVIVLTVLMIAAALAGFVAINADRIRSDNRRDLRHDTVRTAEIIEGEIEEGKRNIIALSELIGRSLHGPEVDISSFQKTIADSTFDYVEFADRYGRNHTITGEETDASDRAYYLEAMQGKSGMEMIFNSRATHENLLMFYAPVYYREDIIGSIIGVYQSAGRMRRMLALEYNGESAKSYLCAADGTIIACNGMEEGTHASQIRDVLAVEEAACEKIDTAVVSGKNCYFTLNDGSDGFLLSMPQTGWHLIQIYPRTVSTQTIRQQGALGVALAVILSLIFAFLLMNVIRTHRRQEQEIQKALEEARTAEQERRQQMRLMQSIAGIYYSMYLIDLRDFHFFEFTAKNEVREVVSADTAQGASVVLPRVLKKTMTQEYLEPALEFAQLSTLAQRMSGKKIISQDFLGKHVGWIRLSFIAVQTDADGLAREVIITTQIVDAEKRREAQLILDSNTDELTGCFNRKKFEDDVMEGPDVPPEEDFVIMMMDVNALKDINDSCGHEAGDLLIRGAVDCMRRCIGNYGRIYRTGGDEFAAIIFADEQMLKAICADFEEAQSLWHGIPEKELSVSTGYAAKREFPRETVRELAKIADQRMYEAKERHYLQAGYDRRAQKTAHKALIALYSKILKVDLTNDTYQVINMDPTERAMSRGFSAHLSEWLYGFGRSGGVHPDDLDNYLQQTEIEKIRAYFRFNKQSMAITYRRRYGDEYKQVAMEIIPADDYSHDHQRVFLFVKQIDK